MGKKARPSDKRRAALKRSELNKIPNISNLTPIERYYALSIRILKTFRIAIADNKLDDAYVFGLRFAKFSTDVLPTHDYYNIKQKNYARLRKDNKNDLNHVIDELENVVELMDLEELEKREMKRREEEAMRLIHKREEEMLKEAEERAATQSLLDRLNMLDNIGTVPTGVVEKKENLQLLKRPSDDLAELENEDTLPIGDLPMPIPYGQGEQQQHQQQHQQHQQPQQYLPPPYDSVSKGISATAPVPALSPLPPSYDALMEQKIQEMDYRQDSIINARPSSSRSLNGTAPMEENSDPGVTAFINPLQGKFIKQFKEKRM